MSDIIDPTPLKHNLQNNLKNNSLVLSKILMSIGNKEAQRIDKLYIIIDMIEQKLFNEDEINKLDSEDLIERYKILRDTVGKSTEYIKSITKTINWEDIDSSINSNYLTTKFPDMKNEENVEDTAVDLIKYLTKVENKKDEGS